MGTHGFHWISHGGYSMLSDLKICSACFFLCQTKLNSHCHRFTLCFVLPCLSLSLTLCATGIEHSDTLSKEKKGLSNNLLEGGQICISVHMQPLSRIHSLLHFTVLVTIFDTLCNLQGPHCKVLSGKSDEMMYCCSCPCLTFPKIQTRLRSCWSYLLRQP